jgi:uroporphyrinogen-III decarboxylase
MINGLINTKPRYHEAEQLFDIEKPKDITRAGYYGEIEKRMLEIVKRLGDVYFVPSDTQSPIDVLTEILQTEAAMLAMFDEPEALHYLLKMLTETIRDILVHQRSIVKNMIGYGHDYPIPYGVHLSDDNAAFLSPSTYGEFALPYNSELSRAFGGVTLHCCMNYRQNMKIMTETDGFLGFDPQTPFNPVDDIVDAITGKGFWRVWDRDRDIEPLEYYKDLIDRTGGRCGLLLDTSGACKDEALRLAYAVKDHAAKHRR